METIRSFSIDLNWVDGTWAPDGVFANASAVHWADWYQALGCTNFWTFAVSYNGRAWYDSAFSPKLSGLAGNFTKDCVAEGHRRGMSVFAYHCLGANPIIAQSHPEWSRQNPDDFFDLIFCDAYLELFCSMVCESARMCEYDGLVIDWFRCPQKRLPMWQPAEKELYEERMGQPFPGEAVLTAKELATFEKRCIEVAWTQISRAVKSVNQNIEIWTNQPFNFAEDLVWNNNVLMREADYILNCILRRTVVSDAAVSGRCAPQWPVGINRASVL